MGIRLVTVGSVTVFVSLRFVTGGSGADLVNLGFVIMVPMTALYIFGS